MWYSSENQFKRLLTLDAFEEFKLKYLLVSMWNRKGRFKATFTLGHMAGIATLPKTFALSGNICFQVMVHTPLPQ